MIRVLHKPLECGTLRIGGEGIDSYIQICEVKGPALYIRIAAGLPNDTTAAGRIGPGRSSVVRTSPYQRSRKYIPDTCTVHPQFIALCSRQRAREKPAEERQGLWFRLLGD